MTDRIDHATEARTPAQVRALLDRAHRMSCSDPSDPSRETTYSMARDAIDVLMKQLSDADRQFTALKVSSGKADARAVDLAAVVEKVRDVASEPRFVNGVDREIMDTLSSAPADALAEHDARLIEGLADIYASGRLTGVFAGRDDYTRAWLRERARQVREGEA